MAAPKRSPVKSAADFQALLPRTVLAQGRGSKQCSRTLLDDGKRHGCRIFEAGREEFGQFRGAQGLVGGHAGPHPGVHEIEERTGMCGGERDQADAVSGQGNVVLHCSIEAPLGADGTAQEVSAG